MTLQQLKYVITVAETGTITEAANKLYISQPSLTNAIHELEKEMNIIILTGRTRESHFLRKAMISSDMPDKYWNKQQFWRINTNTHLVAKKTSVYQRNIILSQ